MAKKKKMEKSQKKKPKKRKDKYHEKLIIHGTLDQVLKVSVPKKKPG
jgi:hypothetical protein